MVRFKNRYLLVTLNPVDDKKGLTEYQGDANSLASSNIASYIRTSLHLNFGNYAAAVTSQSLSIKYCNAATGTVIVRVARDMLMEVWSSIALLTGIPGTCNSNRWIWRVIHVAGTIKGAQKAAIRHAVGILRGRKDTSKDDQREKYVEMMSKCTASINAIK